MIANPASRKVGIISGFTPYPLVNAKRNLLADGSPAG